MTLIRRDVMVGLAALALGGCGGSSSTTPIDAARDAAKAIDAAVPVDAPAVDASTIDAPSYNLACAGQPLPTTAPASVMVSGKAYTIVGLGFGPLGGGTVDALADSGTTVLATTTTATADGTFALSVTTGGTPAADHLHLTKTGYLDSYYYPPVPLAADFTGASSLVLTQGNLDLITTFAQAQDPTTSGYMGVYFVDCAGTPMAGATVQAWQTPAGGSPTMVGAVRYTAGGFPSKTALATDGDGYALVFDIPPGDVNVTATAGSVTYRAHVVKVGANAITITAMVP
jgi:hypothetical protein